MTINNCKVKNRNLNKAKSSKQDEFYTQLSDIEKELRHYKHHFKDKVVLCNCDDPRVSNFTRYFILNFRVLGLKRLIATCYKNQNPDLFSTYATEQAVYMDYCGTDEANGIPKVDDIEIKPLEGDGDFRSAECIELLKQADIVVTNPPFSLLKEYLMQLIKYDKKFLVIGNQMAITYSEIFPLIKSNKLWLGYNSGDMAFMVPEFYEPKETRYWQDETGQKWRSMGNICWFTNLDHNKRNEELVLFRTFNTDEYPKYDNYDAIEVGQVANIPIDYNEGAMGVPITFLEKYNPKQFEIVGATESEGIGLSNGLWDNRSRVKQATVKGRRKFKRIFIRKLN